MQLSTKETYGAHDYLTLEEAAAEFNVTVRQLRHAVEKRRIPSYRPGRYVMLKWLDVHDWIEATKRPAVRSRR
jgi:excisionase family DNA binding protein